jgi:hypothetical protein
MRRTDEDLDRELSELLDVDPVRPVRASLWPAVARALERRRRRDPLLVFGIPATAAAGLLVGVLIGGRPSPQVAKSTADGEDTSDAVPTFLAEEGETLGEFWWDTWGEADPGDTEETS